MSLDYKYKIFISGNHDNFPEGQSGNENEAEKLIEQSLEIPEIRKKEVQKSIDRKDFERPDNSLPAESGMQNRKAFRHRFSMGKDDSGYFRIGKRHKAGAVLHQKNCFFT